MADLLFQNCCDIPVEAKLEGKGTIVIFCPKCGRKSKAIPVCWYRGEYRVSDLESAEHTAKIWNSSVSDPTRIGGFDIPERS